MKTLIVATDFSAESENAVEYAGAAGRLLGAKIVLFNSFTLPTHASNSRLPASVFKDLLDSNHALLKKRAADLSAKYAIKTEYESGFVQLTDELESLFKKHDAQLIIIGTSSQYLAQDLFANSNTAAILKLQVPILSIPLNVVFRPVKKIVFACDVLRGVNIQILDEVRYFAKTMAAEVEVFHVQDKLRERKHAAQISQNEIRINAALEGIPHSFKPTDSNFVVAEIKNEIDRIKADLLIMVPQRYGFWESLVHRSKTRIMASQGNVPLLSIRI